MQASVAKLRLVSEGTCVVYVHARANLHICMQSWMHSHITHVNSAEPIVNLRADKPLLETSLRRKAYMYVIGINTKQYVHRPATNDKGRDAIWRHTQARHY